MAAAALAVPAAVALFFAADPGSELNLDLGDVTILLAALTAFAASVGAARRQPENRRAWTLMAVATGVWSTGQTIWTFYGLAFDHQYPLASPADACFIGYSVPAAAALLSFRRPRLSRVAFARSVLDAAVISAAVLFVSWSTVLGPVYDSTSQDLLARLVGLGYPVVDVTMASLVLVLTMRTASGERLPWVCLGAGLLVLAFTDSVYVKLAFEGATDLTGTPLAAGWVLAFLLIALSAFVPANAGRGRDRRVYSLALELLPYVPVLAAVILVASPLAEGPDPFLLADGLAVLGLVIARQVLILLENVTLTRGLEAKVAQRTAELEGLAAIVDSSGDAIVGMSGEGMITSWNRAAEQVFGHAAEEAMGRNLSLLVPQDRRETGEQYLAAVAHEGRTLAFEAQLARRDGTLVPAAVTMFPVSTAAGNRGVAAIVRDITERRRNEEELLAAREAALESSRLKSEFLAIMSHEIRTPMNGVLGLTSLLLQTPLDETQRQYAQGVNTAGEALLALINDILDFSKLEAGRVELDPAPFEPRPILEEVGTLLAESAHAKNVELITHCHPDVPARLVGDAGRIRQILLNLASNAVKFTPDGEIAISAAVESTDGETVRIRFDVRDTGIGIEERDQERIFDSFAQADASTTRRYGGTGLGLAICRRLAEAMGGQIGVDSRAGAGSTFWFVLPLDVDASEPPAAIPRPLDGMKALVVDDNDTNRLVLGSLLVSWGLRVHAAHGPHQALGMARDAATAGEPFDVVLLDLSMPDLDGLQLAELMRRDPRLTGLKTILLTSAGRPGREELDAAGISEWLMKPVRGSELFDRLARLTAHRPEPALSLTGRPAPPPAPVAQSRGSVLVVEDNEVNQLVARDMVAKLGYTVDVVADGRQALAATEAKDYSLVLMDCHMPVMDGFEATRAIRSRDAGRGRLPIVAMTAGAMDEDRDRCLAAGMDDYLAKPVDLQRLEAILTAWAPASAQNAAGAGVPVLDRDRLALLRELGPEDGQGILPQAAEAFSREATQAMAALRRAADSDDASSAKQAAHRLKGSCANIGATAAATLCEELEQAADSGRTPGHERIDGLEAELAQVHDALEQELAS